MIKENNFIMFKKEIQPRNMLLKKSEKNYSQGVFWETFLNFLFLFEIWYKSNNSLF